MHSSHQQVNLVRPEGNVVDKDCNSTKFSIKWY